MKKMLFLLVFVALLVTNTSSVFAMEKKGDGKMLKNDPVRIRFSSRGLFRRNTSWIFVELKPENFHVNSKFEIDTNARERRELRINDTGIKLLLDELRKAGMVIETQDDYDKKIQLAEQFRLKEAEEKKSFFQRHPKKILAGTVLLTAVGTGALVHWWENR